MKSEKPLLSNRTLRKVLSVIFAESLDTSSENVGSLKQKKRASESSGNLKHAANQVTERRSRPNDDEAAQSECEALVLSRLPPRRCGSPTQGLHATCAMMSPSVSSMCWRNHKSPWEMGMCWRQVLKVQYHFRCCCWMEARRIVVWRRCCLSPSWCTTCLVSQRLQKQERWSNSVSPDVRFWMEVESASPMLPKWGVSTTCVFAKIRNEWMWQPGSTRRGCGINVSHLSEQNLQLLARNELVEHFDHNVTNNIGFLWSLYWREAPSQLFWSQQDAQKRATHRSFTKMCVERCVQNPLEGLSISLALRMTRHTTHGSTHWSESTPL